MKYLALLLLFYTESNANALLLCIVYFGIKFTIFLYCKKWNLGEFSSEKYITSKIEVNIVVFTSCRAKIEIAEMKALHLYPICILKNLNL